jgi:hypothetical protein
MDATYKPSVTIVGAGIAGLTAALKLVQRGCDVTIYDAGTNPGGNLTAFDYGGELYEVYPHMFGEWYNNFWNLVGEIGLKRDTDFEKRPVCGYLKQGDFPNYLTLTDNGSPMTALRNLASGITMIPDMFLSSYAIIDLLTQDFDRPDLTSEQTVNGFVVTRPYATEAMAQLFNNLLVNVWSIDAFLTSVFAFQRFCKFQFREPSPQCWVLKTNSYTQVIDPLCTKLKALGCKFENDKRIDGVSVHDGKVVAISFVKAPTATAVDDLGSVNVENLILAVSPTSLQNLVLKKASASLASDHTVPIVQVLPQLANTRRLKSVPIPVLYAWFNLPFPEIPDYYVALMESKYALTFVRVKGLKNPLGKTVLAIAASDFDALPVDLVIPPPLLAQADMGAPPILATQSVLNEAQRTAIFLILKEFSRYVPFRLGDAWGQGDDVDWDRLFLASTRNQNLFINEVGSRKFVPLNHYPQIANLYFAGDTKENPITIATVEAAVCSGLLAAQAFWRKHGALAEQNPIEIVEPKSYSLGAMLAWKVALAPYAALAKGWSMAEDWRATMGAGNVTTVLPNAASKLVQGVQTATSAYVECWKTFGAVLGLMRR